MCCRTNGYPVACRTLAATSWIGSGRGRWYNFIWAKYPESIASRKQELWDAGVNFTPLEETTIPSGTIPIFV